MPTTLRTRDAVFRTLYENQKRWQRTYSFVKRSTIQKHLKKIYKINVCLSTISYHLWVLRGQGVIRVWQRRRRISGGRWINIASHRSVTGKGIIYLKRMGIKVVSWLYDWAFKGVKPKLVKGRSDLPNDGAIHQQQPRRSAANPLPLEDVLKSALTHLS